MTTQDMADALTGEGIAMEDEVNLVANINGYSERSMLDILYARTGYRTFSQLSDEYDDDNDDDEEED